jgi:leader peptidase (prepilin peptidase) / N-methyltransferase
VLIVACGILGLIVGSFLNVVIHRVPLGQSVVAPASRCPDCQAPIRPRDNVPVLSWVLLRGRASCCGARIPVGYPLVELITALGFAGAAWWIGWSRELPALLLLAAATVALTVIDVQTHKLPFVIVAPVFLAALALLGVAALVTADAQAPVRAVAGAAALWLLYRILHLVHPRGMGYGDVRLAAVLGLYLAWFSWAQLVTGGFLGFLVGAVSSLALLALRRVGWKSHVPYGPFMLAGAWVGLVYGPAIARWYLGMSGITYSG